MAARRPTSAAPDRTGERRHLDRRAPEPRPEPRFGATLLTPLLVAVGIVGFMFVMAIVRPDPGAPSALERRESLVVVAAVMVLVAAMLLVSVTTGSRRSQRAGRVDPGTDRLTGLANRRGLRAEVAERQADRRWLVEVDLDRFAALNDAFGHSIGDALLRRTATILTTAVEPLGGIVARLEGDRFAIAIFDAAPHDLDVALFGIAEELKNAQVDDITLELGCSIGVTCDTGPTVDAESVDARFDALLDEAHLAMSAAKRLGRGRVVHLGDTTREALAAMRSGTIGDGVDVAVRLQRSLADRSIAGASVIPQFRGTGSEPLEVEELQVVADAVNRRFGSLDAVLDGIRRSGRTIPPVGIRLWFSVSAADVVGHGGAEALWARLETVGLSGTPLGVELVGAGRQDPGELAAAIGTIRAHGVDVALPVTGHDAVALSDLARLGADRFVVDADVADAVHRGDSQMQGIVRAVTGLGTQLDTEVIAVGVNTIDAAHRLGELGVSVAQVLLTEPWAPPGRRRAGVTSGDGR